MGIEIDSTDNARHGFDAAICTFYDILLKCTDQPADDIKIYVQCLVFCPSLQIYVPVHTQTIS